MRFAAALLFLLALGCGRAGEQSTSTSCDVEGHAVVVDAATRTLSLCSGRRALERFRVALGRGGVGKAREGDRRTPLGTYALGAPRRSDRYGVFIPIAYPTPGQRRRGLTGSNVGIHGPREAASWLGGATARIDWTAGCVATGTRAEVDRVAAFVRERRPRIVIR
jgi:murein L,D-transpeptidase YafK